MRQFIFLFVLVSLLPMNTALGAGELRPEGGHLRFQPTQTAPRFKPVAAGVGYWEGKRWTSDGPLHIYAAKVDPDQVSVEPVIATTFGRMGLATVSQLAHDHGAIVSINGGFFSWTGVPQGTLVLNQTLVSRTMFNRPSYWIKQNGKAFIQSLEPRPSLEREDGRQLICTRVNETAKRHFLTLYTAHYGKRSGTVPDPSRREYAITQDGFVVAEGDGNLEIPPGGYVVSAQGQACRQLREWLGNRRTVRLNFGIDPSIKHAMGGDLVLVHQQRICVDSTVVPANLLRSREPRTAIGTTADGRHLLVCIDGRRPGHSVGATLGELALAMRDLGAVEALNLDGGGSTTLWLKGRVVNKPTDGCERPVNTAFVVLPRQKAQAPRHMLAPHLAQ